MRHPTCIIINEDDEEELWYPVEYARAMQAVDTRAAQSEYRAHFRRNTMIAAGLIAAFEIVAIVAVFLLVK